MGRAIVNSESGSTCSVISLEDCSEGGVEWAQVGQSIKQLSRTGYPGYTEVSFMVSALA